MNKTHKKKNLCRSYGEENDMKNYKIILNYKDKDI